MPGWRKIALADKKEKKNPSIEQKWFADHTSTVERDFNRQLRAVSSTEMLWQHRTIRQEVSGRIFVPIQSSENGGILYVFPIFGTAEVEQKDG